MIDEKKQAFDAAVQTTILVISRLYTLPCFEWTRIMAGACVLTDEELDAWVKKSNNSIAEAAYAWVTSMCGKRSQAIAEKPTTEQAICLDNANKIIADQEQEIRSLRLQFTALKTRANAEKMVHDAQEALNARQR
jgi:uncharacterized coiled-coil protein SlyX